MGRLQKTHIHAQFNPINQGDFKNNRVKCKHCGWEAIKLADRMERHLLNSCEEYKLSEFTMRAKQS